MGTQKTERNMKFPKYSQHLVLFGETRFFYGTQNITLCTEIDLFHLIHRKSVHFPIKFNHSKIVHSLFQQLSLNFDSPKLRDRDFVWQSTLPNK